MTTWKKPELSDLQQGDYIKLPTTVEEDYIFVCKANPHNDLGFGIVVRQCSNLFELDEFSWDGLVITEWKRGDKVLWKEECKPCDKCRGVGSSHVKQERGSNKFEAIGCCPKCQGKGYVKADELEPVWDLDNPVLALMRDLRGYSIEYYLKILRTSKHRQLYILATMWGLKKALKDESKYKNIAGTYCSYPKYCCVKKKWIRCETSGHLFPPLYAEHCLKVCEYLNTHFPTGWKLEQDEKEKAIMDEQKWEHDNGAGY